MTTRNGPKKHHYIPEFFLRQWVGDDGKFERYNRPIPAKIMVRRSFPSEAGWINDLYTSPGDPNGIHWLELDIFQVIDSRAALVLQKMNAEPQVQLNSTERSEWTVFILSLFHRTPDNLQATITSAMKMFDETLDSARGIYPNLRGDNDPITFEDYRDGLTLAERRRSALNSLPSVMTNQAIGQFMHDMHTQVFTLPAGPRDFLLSDDPIARTNGWKTDDGHFAIPISPRKLFVSAWKLETLNRFARMKPEEIVAAMNTVSVEGARFFVAAKDQSQDRFIRNRFGRNLRSSIYSQPDIPLPLTKITI